MSTLMTLNDSEPRKEGLVNFSRFWAATRISRVNCAEMAKKEFLKMSTSMTLNDFKPTKIIVLVIFGDLWP